MMGKGTDTAVIDDVPEEDDDPEEDAKSTGRPTKKEQRMTTNKVMSLVP